MSELELAWVGSCLALPLASAAVLLAIRACRVPKDGALTCGRETFEQLRANLAALGGHHLGQH